MNFDETPIRGKSKFVLADALLLQHALGQRLWEVGRHRIRDRVTLSDGDRIDIVGDSGGYFWRAGRPVRQIGVALDVDFRIVEVGEDLLARHVVGNRCDMSQLE